MKVLLAIIGFLKRLFFPPPPPRCAVCNRIMKDKTQLWCGNCYYIPCDEIKYSRYKHKFAGVVAGALYFEDLKRAMWRIKKVPDERTLQFLAFLMHDSMNEYLTDVLYDVIVPVPLNAVKLKERGFNQAEKLAEALSERINVPVEANALIRHDTSETQHTLGKRSRYENAERSYAATDSDCVKGKAVLLVDDLYTTGATVSVCTNRLLEMGAKSVYVATAVWTPPRQQANNAPHEVELPISEKREFPVGTRRLAFTGHRPHTIGLPEDESAPAMVALKEALAYRIDWLIENKQVKSFLSGLALGIDMIAAEMILERMETNPDLELEVVIPFKGQTTKWKQRDVERYNAILSSGKVVQRYTPDERYMGKESYHRRNAYLAENCTYLLAVWNGEPSGTGITVNMAKKLGKRCIIVDPKECISKA